MNKRKIFLLVICGALIAFTAFFAIYDNVKAKNNPEGSDTSKPLKVVCTIFPEYDWAKNIIGDATDKVELSLIVKNGVDLHSFQPSTQDILEISTADILVYVGGVSDNWVTDVLKTVKTQSEMSSRQIMKPQACTPVFLTLPSSIFAYLMVS